MVEKVNFTQCVCLLIQLKNLEEVKMVNLCYLCFTTIKEKESERAVHTYLLQPPHTSWPFDLFWVIATLVMISILVNIGNITVISS